MYSSYIETWYNKRWMGIQRVWKVAMVMRYHGYASYATCWQWNNEISCPTIDLLAEQLDGDPGRSAQGLRTFHRVEEAFGKGFVQELETHRIRNPGMSYLKVLRHLQLNLSVWFLHKDQQWCNLNTPKGTPQHLFIHSILWLVVSVCFSQFSSLL